MKSAICGAVMFVAARNLCSMHAEHMLGFEISYEMWVVLGKK